MTSRNLPRRSVSPHELPAFAPVPRKNPRHDGWTPERQRAFIEALADTGCVAIACRMVNMSQRSFYQLRRQPGAEGFRAAAEAAQSLGLQCLKDEAFDRALNGELIPVFVAGKLMGFRRKKNDRLLMFILRHYGQDAQGRKTTINYFSTRATAGAASQNPPRDGEGDRSPQANGGGGSASLSQAEASTTTVKTIISGNPGQTTTSARETDAANLLNTFEGIALDEAAQAEIYRALEACAERRRALDEDPENDPGRAYIALEDAPGDFIGALESGVEEDWIDYRSGACPELGRRGEHRWESLGEGGQAAEIDRVVGEIEQRRAARTPAQIAAEEAEHEARARQMREERDKRKALPAPDASLPASPEEGRSSDDLDDPDDPVLDWRNWADGGYRAPSPEAAHPEALPSEEPIRAKPMEGPVLEPSPNPQAPTPKPQPRKASPEQGRRTYKKRQPKPRFTASVLSEYEEAYGARKAQAAADVEAERRELAAAEAERRRRRKGGDSCS